MGHYYDCPMCHEEDGMAGCACCSYCWGKGVNPMDQTLNCAYCNGTGKKSVMRALEKEKKDGSLRAVSRVWRGKGAHSLVQPSSKSARTTRAKGGTREVQRPEGSGGALNRVLSGADVGT